ncbi:MAG: hypothetical protein PHP82_02040 [Candidatus ainarchaeum sp.]|nr:hypothetical protein [Candidatus ainarchaeum sp.]
MKKITLFILILFLILSLGCTEINFKSNTYDCGQDWGCFSEKLLFCEPASVEVKEVVGLGRYYHPTITEFFTVVNSNVQILKRDEDNYCVVDFSELDEKTKSIFPGKAQEYILNNRYSKVRVFFTATCSAESEYKCKSTPIISHIRELK